MNPRLDALLVLAGLSLSSQVFAVADEPPPVTEAETRVTAGVARDRARLLHQVYLASLETMHKHYFHGERAIVPARALEDVFAEVAKNSQTEARWISVNTKAMSVRHEPKSEFEKQAAAEIAKGAAQVEKIEQGFYQRATAIPLGDSCIQCHTGFFAQAPKSARYAGLVIRIKLAPETEIAR